MSKANQIVVYTWECAVWCGECGVGECGEGECGVGECGVGECGVGECGSGRLWSMGVKRRGVGCCVKWWE